jgi:aspartate/methionine/tyrosine aminotransferase
MKPIAERINVINPFIVMTLLEKALEMERNGHSIVHFEIGEPDFDSPPAILAAAKKACNSGKTHYTHSLGNLDLRKAIAKNKKETRNLTYDPFSEMMVTAGTSPGFLMIMGSLINPGDEVLIPNPGYSCYPNHVKFFGGKPVEIPLFEVENFDMDPDRLEAAITPKSKILLLNSPSNPTGQIIPEKSLKKIADLAIKHDLWVLSDEIYAELVYDQPIAPSISSLPEMKDRTIVLDGFSKFYAMTGFRLGYVLAPASLIQEMNKINQNYMISAPSVSQEAGLAAFECKKETISMRNIYKQRRDYITNRLNAMPGVHINIPQGAFYAFANFSTLTKDTKTFSFELLDQAHIAATPGIGFGSQGEGFIRFSYCTDQKNIEEGMNRLERFLEKRQKK